MPPLLDVEGDLEHIVEEPVGEGRVETHVASVGIHDHTLLVTVGEVSAVGSALVSAADGHIVVVCECSAGNLLEPVGLVAEVLEVGLARPDILCGHHVKGLAECRCRNVT